MKIDEYFIIPVELLPTELAEVRAEIGKLELSTSDLPGSGDYETFVVYEPFDAVDPPASLGTTADLHVALVDTCLCLVYHQFVEVAEHTDEGRPIWVKATLDRKEAILKEVEDDLQLLPVRTALSRLRAAEAKRPSQPYGLSVYVLAIDHPMDASNRGQSMLDDISKVLKAPTLEAHWASTSFSAVEPLAEDVDSSPTSALYASYSAVVGVTWPNTATQAQQPESSGITEILLRLQLSLQAAWNRCHQASIRVDDFLLSLAQHDKAADANRVDSQDYFTMVRAAQLGRRALSSAGSSRERKIFDKLVETSRIHDEIDALSRGLEALDKVLRRLNERRIEIGQSVIAGIFALFAGTGTTQAIFALFDFARLMEAIAAIGVGVVASCLALWVTRPGRKVLRVRTDTYPF